MKEKEERQAVFWCSLLALVIYDEVGIGQVHAFLKQLSNTDVVFPDGQRKKPSLSTLKRKLKKYRQQGFKALERKQRSDKGTPRAVSPEIINKAVELKKRPARSLLENHQPVPVPLLRHNRCPCHTVSSPETKRCHPLKTWCNEKAGSLPLEPGPAEPAVDRRFFLWPLCTS